MNESRKGTAESTGKEKQPSSGDKLKNEASAGEAMRKKLRHGKKDNSLTKEEAVKKRKLQKQGRKKAFKEAAVVSGTRRQIVRNEDENVGTSAMESALGASETALYETRKNHYSNKLHEKKKQEEIKKENATKHGSSNPSSRVAQKKRMKKEFEAAAHKKQAAETANKFGSISQKFVDKAEEITGMIAEFVAEHPMECLIAVAIFAVILIVVGSLSSCSAITGGISNMTVATSYTAQDDQILAVEADYTQLETDLQTKIDHIESDYPGYDEYRYSLANIAHNPYQLAALLTVLYEDYTESEVQAMLQTIFDSQYTLTIQRIVETRTRTETRTGHRTVHHADGTTSRESYTYEVEVEYQYYILQTTLTNNTLDSVVRGMGLTADQMQRYELLLETYGNKAYLFGDDIYSVVEPGEFTDYEIPPEALTDQKFANMIREAEKYLGYPYVWGGSSPSTSFDCSGFVSYVINHCGNGWSMGRQTANGLLGKCTRVSPSEAKPGDLIFFQGTYNTSGASHVGIYVGNNMMIHCGNPIQYASISSNYWQNHFYTFGRIN
jgi:cell wall-associated NlpC family hydrolase